MCGICGIVFSHKSGYSPEDFTLMARQLRHRGPDDEGFLFENNVWLGSTRLSILDIPHGKQPMWNEEQTVVTVYNGEIYNFLDLKSGLEARGHEFKSNCDTEVLVHLYEEQGEEFVSKLNGMFAFAVWDKEKRQLLLARDRMGIKPLYYTEFGGNLLFASEIRAILALPGISREIDPDGLSEFLTYDATPAPRTILKSIKKLQAGQLLTWKDGMSRTKHYASVMVSEQPISKQVSFDALASQMKNTLTNAIKRHLISDVPLGVFLSGGLDSSFLTAMISQIIQSPVKTFSIVFEEDSFDESRFSRMVASHLGTDHHETLLSSQEALELTVKITDFMDEPLSDPAILPTFLLSKAARTQVVVAVSGEGSDELFYGYPTYSAHLLARYYNFLPRFVREKVIQPFIEKLPASERNFSFDFIAKRFVRGAQLELPERHTMWMSSLPPNKQALFTHDFYTSLRDKSGFGPLREFCKKLPPNSDPLFVASYLDLVLYLQDGILMRTDKASMANSLEVRVPFLDTEVMQLARSFPRQAHLRGFTSKRLLRYLAQDLLPREVILRRKKGFGLPIAGWLKTTFKEILLDHLSEERVRKQGIFRPEAVTKLIFEHMNNVENHRKALWSLLVFQLWYNKFVKS